jgi:hypothetical protein
LTLLIISELQQLKVDLIGAGEGLKGRSPVGVKGRLPSPWEYVRTLF